VLARDSASQGVVKLTAHYLPELEAMGNVESGRRGPLENYRTIYEAQVFASGNSVELLKKSSTLETAPVERSKQTQPTQP
jgi:hypothetical protein